MLVTISKGFNSIKKNRNLIRTFYDSMVFNNGLGILLNWQQVKE